MVQALGEEGHKATMEELAMTMIGKIKAFGERFAQDEIGISAVEYGLLAAGIALVVYTAASGVGTDLQSIYTKVGTDLSTAAGS